MDPVDAPATTVLRLRPDRLQRLEALLSGAGPHLEPVLDVGSATNGDLLVVLPAPAVRLTSLLEAPGGLTAGEAVTVLVPLAQALLRLHDAGVAHGGVRAAAVVLDADGSPSWTAPLAPTLLRAAGAQRFAERAAADVAGFLELGAALLAPSGLRLPEADGLAALVDALFRLARPEPVRLVRRTPPGPAAPIVSGPPARLVPAATPAEPPDDLARGTSPAVLRGLRTVRPRVWAALGGVVALLVAAVIALPGGGGAAAPADPPRVRASPTVATTPAARAGLDATTAVVALVAARDRCLAAGSGSCLRRVDAAGSPVLEADLRAVAAGVDAVHVDRARLRVAAATAGTAIATAGGATVLAIRDRDDWRLRDVVAEPPGKG